MIAYIAFVAVVNLLLGMLLAKILPPAKLRRTELPSIELPDPPARTVVLPPSSVTRVEPIEREPVVPVAHEDESESHRERKAPPAALKTWADFAQQLRDVKDRTRYCRSSQDMRLARQAADQLKACAQIWYAQFEKCLLGEELDEATKSLVEGADMGAIEMFAAQIETTLTNLNALNFEGPFEEVLNSLERELGLLDDQQKSVSRRPKPAMARL